MSTSLVAAPVVPPTVLEEIEEHVFSVLDREVGGVLLGRLPVAGPAEVAVALPALAADAGSAHVTFTHEVWEDVHRRIDDEHPDLSIVGWYHSHPGFGVFLSEYDVFLHSNFFSDPRMVALVVDPQSGTLGWFAQSGNGVGQVATGTTRRPAQRPPAAAPRSAATGSGRARVPLALAGPALLLAGAIGGYLLAGSAVVPAAPADGPRAGTAAPGGINSPAERAAAETPARAELAAAEARAEAADRRILALEAELAAVSVPTEPTVLSYRVRRGDTFWELAESFYGSGSEAPRLVGANVAFDPLRLPVGAELAIPVDAPGKR